MLKHRLAVSDIEDFTSPGGRVLRTIDEVDGRVIPDKVKKVIFCSGKVYYDLYTTRDKKWEESDMSDVAICRLE